MHVSPWLCDSIQKPWTRTPFAHHTPSDTPVTFPSPIFSVTGKCHVTSPTYDPCSQFGNYHKLVILHHIRFSNPTEIHPLCHVYRAFMLRHYTLCNKPTHQKLFLVPNQKRLSVQLPVIMPINQALVLHKHIFLCVAFLCITPNIYQPYTPVYLPNMKKNTS
jgi:hypothetical protein